ncbi:MAG: polysaccharide deacetylase family protein [Bradyrhizobiaceae bacterium]|nr:polysaccharide deacetylase family protein [Bradyrhizobiaceae bacterium]
MHRIFVMARTIAGALVMGLASLTATMVRAAECPGHPDAIGTSRTIYVDQAEHPRIGTMQYPETLPLNDHEVVLTFDDGPLPPKTNRVLDILASECVKATFFSVGRMAQAYPDLLRRELAEGHSIGTHTQNHPLNFKHAPLTTVEKEVDEGIASVSAALGDPKAVAPFFRIPGLEREQLLDDYLNSRGLMIWSADFPADDWKHIKASQIYHRALARIEAKHKGILLLHDIQPATVAALPLLLSELKHRGYHIVHVEPAKVDQPKTPTDPSQWLMSGKKTNWSAEVVSIDGVFNNESSNSDLSRVAKTKPNLLESNQSGSSTAAESGPTQAREKDRVAMRIPLPPVRPRAAGIAISLPPPSPSASSRSFGPTGAPSEHSELSTGSIGTAPNSTGAPTVIDDGETILRPSVDIPMPKPPVTANERNPAQ